MLRVSFLVQWLKASGFQVLGFVGGRRLQDLGFGGVGSRVPRVQGFRASGFMALGFRLEIRIQGAVFEVYRSLVVEACFVRSSK